MSFTIIGIYDLTFYFINYVSTIIVFILQNIEHFERMQSHRKKTLLAPLSFCLLLFFLTPSLLRALDKKTIPLFFPITLSIPGLQSILGFAAGAANIGPNDLTLITAWTSSSVIPSASLSSLGLFIGGIKLKNKGVLSVGFAGIEELHLLTNYSRGLSSAQFFDQQVSALGGFISIKQNILGATKQKEKWQTSFQIVFAGINFDGYFVGRHGAQVLERDVIPAYIFLNLAYKMKWNEWENKNEAPRIGSTVSLEFKINQQLPMSLGSHFVLNTRWKHYQPLGTPLVKLIFSIGRSDSSVLSRSIYTDEESIRSAYERNFCEGGTISPSSIPACQILENDFTKFLVNRFRYGQADALGGTGLLRGYPVNRFEAAHTASESLEIEWDILNTFKAGFPVLGFYMVFFNDWGHANDNIYKLYNGTVSSWGLGFRLVLPNSIEFRLEHARNREGEYTYFTLGIDFL